MTSPLKIAIIGAGFTGLTAALRLSKHHQVTVFEKEKFSGGLSATFKLPSWTWPVEQHYHHWFTNDVSFTGLLKELQLSDLIIRSKTQTAIYYHGRIYPFNTPGQVLSFSPIGFFQRLRTGLASLYLKLLPKNIGLSLEKETAYRSVEKYFGGEAFRVIWQPLLDGKFGRFGKLVNMAWFWARIKKRTMKLVYMSGGYQTLLDGLVKNISNNGARVLFNTSFNPAKYSEFDKIIFTAPSGEFIRLYPRLPKSYKKQLSSIPHLTALTLLLITNEKILPETYWLNINDRKFPFISVIQQTNMIDKKYYGNNHITYVGNYLPDDHPYLKMSKEQLFKLYLPYLKKINPNLQLIPPQRGPAIWRRDPANGGATFRLQLFNNPFAQPVFSVNYSKIKPDFATPIPNVYLANMDMVYPWDRGTNYAIELGEQVANLVQQ